MSTAASGLRELHQLHIQLRDVNEKLARGPKQIKARELFVQRKQAELETQKEKLITQKKAADERSLQLKTNEAKIAELRGKLNTASSNREFDIINGQIAADTMANSVLEDEILECLEKVDQAQVEHGKLGEEVQAALAQVERLSKETADAEPGLREEAASLGAAIAEAEKGLPGDVAVVYRRLLNAHGSGALAAVVNGACSECNVGLSPQSRVELNSGKITFCRPCGRLLYLPEGE